MTEKKKIFILEDDVDLVRLFQRTLQNNGFEVDSAYDIESAKVKLSAQPPHLAIFDLVLPDGRSDHLLTELRNKQQNYPIVFLSGHHEVDDKINGLKRGADDYLPKPIDPRELALRVKAVLRRYDQVAVFSRGDFSFDSISTRVFYQNKELLLQPKEFSVLKFLALNEPNIITSDVLLKEVWGITFDPQTKIVAVCISRLRKSLQETFGVSPVITIRGEGYLFQSQKK
ncbi:MAG: response regulator transcription factor [Bacteroidetes bacterium]|nr:response regulator transcription factor [Bacteroidota bacterium]